MPSYLTSLALFLISTSAISSLFMVSNTYAMPMVPHNPLQPSLRRHVPQNQPSSFACLFRSCFTQPSVLDHPLDPRPENINKDDYEESTNPISESSLTNNQKWSTSKKHSKSSRKSKPFRTRTTTSIKEENPTDMMKPDNDHDHDHDDAKPSTSMSSPTQQESEITRNPITTSVLPHSSVHFSPSSSTSSLHSLTGPSRFRKSASVDSKLFDLMEQSATSAQTTLSPSTLRSQSFLIELSSPSLLDGGNIATMKSEHEAIRKALMQMFDERVKQYLEFDTRYDFYVVQNGISVAFNARGVPSSTNTDTPSTSNNAVTEPNIASGSGSEPVEFAAAELANSVSMERQRLLDSIASLPYVKSVMPVSSAQLLASQRSALAELSRTDSILSDASDELDNLPDPMISQLLRPGIFGTGGKGGRQRGVNPDSDNVVPEIEALRLGGDEVVEGYVNPMSQ